MIQKKICMLGAFAVGKTSLVGRFAHSLFSEKYHTTVGVKIDKRVLTVGDQELTLILWDLHGEDDFQSVRASYLRGSAGNILVADGTRRHTLDTAVRLRAVAEDAVGPVPSVLVVNKCDLGSEWDIDDSVLEGLVRDGWTVKRASAKIGEGVHEAYVTLARKVLGL